MRLPLGVAGAANPIAAAIPVTAIAVLGGAAHPHHGRHVRQAELALAYAVDAHPQLQKLSYTCRQTRARDLIERATMRNRDKARLQRQQTRRLLGQQGLAPAPSAAGAPAKQQPLPPPPPPKDNTKQLV